MCKAGFTDDEALRAVFPSCVCNIRKVFSVAPIVYVWYSPCVEPKLTWVASVRKTDLRGQYSRAGSRLGFSRVGALLSWRGILHDMPARCER